MIYKQNGSEKENENDEYNGRNFLYWILAHNDSRDTAHIRSGFSP